MTIETKFNIGADVCPFCSGTAICKSVDLKNLPDGITDLNNAIMDFGEDTECINGCRIIN